MREVATYEMAVNAAILLMQASPIKQTTTLEVKTLLRNLNLEAIQSDVSTAMNVMAEQLKLYNGVVTEGDESFKVYSFEPIVEDDPEVTDPSMFQFRK